MQDLGDATVEAPDSDQVGAEAEHNPLPRLLRLFGQSNTAAAESSLARAAICAAQSPSEQSGTGRDERRLGRGEETTYPYGDPLAAANFVPLRRHSAGQTSQSPPKSLPAAKSHERSAYHAQANAAADDHSSFDKHPLLWQPRVSRGVSLGIIGVAASALVGTLAGLGYYALSPSETISKVTIADNSAGTKTTAIGQNASAEELDPQAVAASWSDEPKKVRTVSIRLDGETAEMRAVQPSTNVTPEFNAAPMPRARPNAAGRRSARP